MNGVPFNLIGKKFGRLTVVSQAESKNHSTYWNCLCDCGNAKTVQGVKLVHGTTKSCGCLNRDIVISRNKANADGKYRHPRIYNIYYGMRTRCYNEDDAGYFWYGARGITVCDEWMSDFFSFQSWALANGYRDDLTIDRIDNNGNYEPGNCRWADIEIQANNRRGTLMLTMNGETLSATQWARRLGISRATVYARLSKGWSVEDTLAIPVGKYHGGVGHSHWDEAI